jgi:DNA topoisomerase-1
MQGLVYVSDQKSGIHRKRAGRGFSYVGPDGQCLKGEDRKRSEKLAVPPAWRDVWICPNGDGHIQATGFDARGRKQYIYHPDWTAEKSSTKYAALVDFGNALPTLRKRLTNTLRQAPGGRDFTIAALVLLLDRSFLRIGNPEYAAQNASFGAATLLRRHVRLGKDGIRLDFTAKGGKRVRQVLRDRRLHRVLQAVGDLRGRNLFTYIDEDGTPRAITSGDVNGWLASVMGPDVTAKTFRTWGGTLAAFDHARSLDANAPLTIKSMADAAAECLHNTPAVCRSSYIHPDVLNLANIDPVPRHEYLVALPRENVPGLQISEQKLLSFLSPGGKRT